MSRKKSAQKREVLRDPKYNEIVLTKLVSKIMFGGKKSTAEGIVYGALDLIKEKTGEDPIKYFHKALNNIKPQVEVKSRRVGGATYQVPVEVRPERQESLALRWLTAYARDRKSEKRMVEKIAAELIDAYNNRGGSFKKKDDTHRMAEANRAFAHYRW
ncbi:MAG: 30S ribosomal protein S7 [Oligoflexia bacterium]|nr:30S ribosomal protein S7 [Oligoflexia bacterium]